MRSAHAHTCETEGAHEEWLNSADSKVVCVANMDAHGAELPPASVVGDAEPTALGALGAKDVMQGESLLRRDLMLRLMTAVDPESCAWHVYRHVCGRVSGNRHAHRHVHRP